MLYCVVAEKRQHSSICYFRENYISLLLMPPQGLELREQFPLKDPCCFPTRKIIDAGKTLGIFHSSCRQLCWFQTARQPVRLLVAWDRWCVFWRLTATSLKWGSKCAFFPPKEGQSSQSYCSDLCLPKDFIPKTLHILKRTNSAFSLEFSNSKENKYENKAWIQEPLFALLIVIVVIFFSFSKLSFQRCRNCLGNRNDQIHYLTYVIVYVFGLWE